MDSIEEASSFRDPDGFVFVKEGRIYRQINVTYRENYELLVCSGLYESLVKEGLLIPHEECPISMKVSCNAYKVIQPEEIEFISYPYEWCFSQFKDAALCLLRIMEIALEYSMILKDASAYNIQFKKGKPVLIDTLSFTKYEKWQPWVAYRQFCQHFVAPLATMSQCDIRLSQLLRIYIDGLPLDLISKLLPFRSVLNFFLLSHVYLHARSQEYFAKHSLNNPKKSITLPNIGLKGIIQNLQDGIKKLNLKYRYSTWGNYYANTNYSEDAFLDKKRIVMSFLDDLQPMSKILWDIGANDGTFSKLAAEKGMVVISMDNDAITVEKNYLNTKILNELHIFPLLIDIMNPSCNLGWANKERKSLLERKRPDAIMALALIHHLAISNNLPFEKIADFFHRITTSLIIEFIPKTDSQIQKLLLNREDIFKDYSQENFEKAFQRHFAIVRMVEIHDSERKIYLMRSHR